MKVRCINNKNNSLCITIGKEYLVVEERGDLYFIFNDYNVNGVFKKELFEIVNISNQMKEINLKDLINSLLDNKEYKSIQALDGDNEYHKVNSIDVIRKRINCDDDWYQYFDSFTGNYSKLFVEE